MKAKKAENISQKRQTGLAFVKMTGLGNDYVYLDGFGQPISNPARLAVRMSDRHFGVGSDGLVLILPSRHADARMRMFNADGSEAEMCGNAIRCVARYLFERRGVRSNPLNVETKAGIKTIHLVIRNGRMTAATVDMGVPILDPDRIPVAAASNRISLRGREWTCVSMGNPHAVTFVDSIETAPVQTEGPLLERDPIFPKRCNIEFAQVINRRRIRLRVWERGAGETMACGTGACATLVAAVLNGLTDRQATIELPGGNLRIEWRKEDGHVVMTGGAEFVFEGTWLKG